MVEHVNKVFRLGFIACACLLAVQAAFAVAADNWRDPTTPPASFGTAPSQGSGYAAASGPMLQSVMISPGRRVAVISGQAVALGGKYGDAQVVRITESEVVLQNGSGLQTIRLFPGVEKKMSSRAEQRNELRRH